MGDVRDACAAKLHLRAIVPSSLTITNILTIILTNIFRANLRALRRHAHSKPLIEIRAKQDCYYWSLFLRSIRQWNNLPINSFELLGIQFNNEV